MGDENGAGKIEIINSKVEATSYYPALYTEGTLTVNGGEVKCTSTADAAIWTQGDILIKGGAKITTDGKYPMGGNGTFAVEEAEIDAVECFLQFIQEWIGKIKSGEIIR